MTAFQPITKFGFRVEICDLQFNPNLKHVRVTKVDPEWMVTEELDKVCDSTLKMNTGESEDQWFIRQAKETIDANISKREGDTFSANHGQRSLWA